MPIKSNRTHSSLTSKLDILAEGIVKHSTEPNFPANVKEEDIRAMRSELDTLRTMYKELTTETRIKYREYVSRFEAFNKKHAQTASLIYAFFGKTNQVLADFGLKPHKVRTSAKVPPVETAKPA
ncbi:MAG: hypothetical protein COZ25_03500 [Ignavibacteria bacterium CG_4_10_14_3_um_filter_37_18]|nr:MAG: hypothetical protein COZ25_03500 [Ignavibacteria bacterium CG_4_10_14_3_um_filter_37_18]